MKLNELAAELGLGRPELESVCAELGVPVPPGDTELTQEDIGALKSLMHLDAAAPSTTEPGVGGGSLSHTELIDQLGDAMNEMGEDADIINGADPGVVDAPHEVVADDQGWEGPRTTVPEFIESVTLSTKRSWRARRGINSEYGDLSLDIGDGWKPRWMLMMLMAALLLGTGTMLVIEAQQQDEGAVDAIGVVAAPAIGTCYSVDSLGNTLVSSCAGGYDFQVVGVFEIAGDDRPADELAMVDARLRCIDEHASRSGKSLPPEAEMQARLPSPIEWSAGSRTVVCEVHARGTGVLRGTML